MFYTKLSKAKSKWKSKPGLTKGILKSIKHKNKLYKNFSKINYINQLKVQGYKNYRNKLTKIKKVSKKAYYEHRLINSTKNTSEVWRIMNGFVSCMKTDLLF